MPAFCSSELAAPARRSGARRSHLQGRRGRPGRAGPCERTDDRCSSMPTRAPRGRASRPGLRRRRSCARLASTYSAYADQVALPAAFATSNACWAYRSAVSRSDSSHQSCPRWKANSATSIGRASRDSERQALLVTGLGRVRVCLPERSIGHAVQRCDHARNVLELAPDC